jgi:hypothetical protein
MIQHQYGGAGLAPLYSIFMDECVSPCMLLEMLKESKALAAAFAEDSGYILFIVIFNYIRLIIHNIMIKSFIIFR